MRTLKCLPRTRQTIQISKVAVEEDTQGDADADLAGTDGHEHPLKTDPQEMVWEKVAGGVVENAPEIPGKCEYIPWSDGSSGCTSNRTVFMSSTTALHMRA